MQILISVMSGLNVQICEQKFNIKMSFYIISPAWGLTS